MTIPLPLLVLAQGVGSPPANHDPRSAIELYFQAQARGNGEYIRQAVTADAKIAFVDHGQVEQWTRDEFAARFHGPARDEYRPGSPG
jgi:Putative lumazine-binding